MTEQEYDEQIAPALAEIANKVAALGGSMVARVEWQKDEAGITCCGISDACGVGQHLTRMAAHSRGNIDQLFIWVGRQFDLSQTIIGRALGKDWQVH